MTVETAFSTFGSAVEQHTIAGTERFGGGLVWDPESLVAPGTAVEESPRDPTSFRSVEETLNQTSGCPSTDVGEYQTFVDPKSPVVEVPEFDKGTESFEALQRWEGYVVEVSRDCCIVRLVDMDNRMNDAEAELLLDEVDPGDHDLVVIGAVFYWHIGYLERKSGRISASNIRFRRMPAWSRNELKAARTRANRILEELERE